MKDKNTILIYESTVTKIDKVWLCYGHKEYKKFNKKRYKCLNEQIAKAGVTTLWDRHNGSYEVCIGVKKIDNPIQLKGLIVHELSHAIDYIMRENDLIDGEYKAYAMQSMYQIAIEFIDRILSSNTTSGSKGIKKYRDKLNKR